MFSKIIFLIVIQVICESSAQYKDSAATINSVGQSLTWTHSTTMGAYRIKVIAPADSLIQATCNIQTNCNFQSFVISRSGELDLSRDGRKYCGNVNLPVTLSIGNEMVVALNANANEGATFRCVFTSIAQTDANCECGWRKAARIAGGTVASANEFVSHVAFVYTSSSTNHELFCGGIIISQYFVLSAAHCAVAFPDVSKTSVLAGDHDITTGSDTPWAAAYKLNNWIKHSGFVEATGLNDIALAKTQTYIRFTLGVGPACLPYTFNNNPMEGYILTAAGWGTSEFAGPSSDVLMKVNLKVISNTECATKMKNIDNTKICTFNGKSSGDTCQKDSGGGLYYIINNRQYNIAIVNYGIGCAGNYPSVNTRLDRYFGWIEANTGRKFFCRK